MKKRMQLSKILFVLLLSLMYLAASGTIIQARDVTFSWTPNDETVDGYRLYYKTGETGGAPYDGKGIIEGDSPITLGPVSSISLTGLSDTQTHFFAVTAFIGASESDYSKELTLAPLDPVPIVYTTADFSWLPNEESNLAGYRIYFGTTSRIYPESFDIGSPAPVDGRIHGQVDNLKVGTTYYFAVAAYNTDGEQSDYSAELVWTATAKTTEPPPVGEDSTISTTEDLAVSEKVTATNTSGLTIQYQIQQDVSHGTLIFETQSGNYTYTPQDDYAGEDFFTYLAIDNNGSSDPVTVTISITPVNDPPVASGLTFTVNEDTAYSGQLTASDPDGDTLSFSTSSQPTRGILTLRTDGTFIYTPASNATGTDSFSYQVSDGLASSNMATVNITITAINDPPVALNGSITAEIGKTTSGTLSAKDPDNEPLTYTIVSDPFHIVTLTNPATGAYTISPLEGMATPYSFTFSALDAAKASTTAAVFVDILLPGTLTETFGDTEESTHINTLTDTYTNLNGEINSEAEFISTWAWSEGSPHKPANTIIIKVDLSSLVNVGQITEAKLYLYQTSATGEQTITNSIHKITGKNPILNQTTGLNAFNGEPWTPVKPGTTHNDTPLGLADIGPAEDTITLGTKTGYQIWTITKMVQEWADTPDTNLGLLIQSAEATVETGRTFASSENQTRSLRPKLVIRYLPKPPKPQVISAQKVN